MCFADLVGFTRLGEEVAPDELGRLAARLEALAFDVATAPVRLVKTIGDAAMLAAPTAEPLLDAALELIDAAEREGSDFPQLRAGAASGMARAARGRLVRQAGEPRQPHHRGGAAGQPADRARAARSGGRALPLRFAGEHRLRGIRERVTLFRVRHQETESELAAERLAGGRQRAACSGSSAGRRASGAPADSRHGAFPAAHRSFSAIASL